MHRMGFLLIVLATTGLLTACPPKMSGTGNVPNTVGSSSTAKEGTTLAKVGQTVITVEEFEEKINKQSPFIRSRYSDLEKRREYLDNQIRFELLAQEAHKRGLGALPEVQESLKKIMVQKLTREEFDNRVKLDDISDPEIEKYYNEHTEDYHKPEMVRTAHIFFPSGSNKAAAQSSAKKILNELKAKKDDRMAFRTLAKEHSADEETKNSGGDLRYMSKDQYREKYGETVATTVFDLKQLNDLSAVVEGTHGFHIFKQTGRRQAIDRTIDQVRTQIRNRLYRDKRTTAFNTFVDGLRKDLGVTIDENKLAALKIIGSPQPVDGPVPGQGPKPPVAAPKAPMAPTPKQPAPPKAPVKKPEPAPAAPAKAAPAKAAPAKAAPAKAAPAKAAPAKAPAAAPAK